MFWFQFLSTKWVTRSGNSKDRQCNGHNNGNKQNITQKTTIEEQRYVIKFVSDLLQVGGFLRVLLFLPPIKLTVTIFSTKIPKIHNLCKRKKKKNFNLYIKINFGGSVSKQQTNISL
jgi:hypothetical protein